MGQDRREDDQAEAQGGQPGDRAPQPDLFARTRGLGVHRVALAAEHGLAQHIADDRHRQHHHRQGVGLGAVLHLLEPREDLHRGDLVVIEHQRRAQLGERPDEHDGRAREQPRPDQRQRDLEEPTPRTGAQVLGALVQRGVQVGQRRRGVEVDDGVKVQGLDDDHAPELVGPEQVEIRAQQRVERARTAHQRPQAQSSHERGEDQGDEDRRVERLLEREAVVGAEHRQR